MEPIKIATAIGGHGPQMLYPTGRHPPGHQPGPQVIHPPTTRAYDGPPYKGTLSPPVAARSAAYATYGPMVDGPHRYIPQPTYIPTYPRDSHYARSMTDRPVLMPLASRRPSIMGPYGGYKEMVQMQPTSIMGTSHSGDSYNRMKLSQGMRSDVRYAPLVVDTNENHTSRESSYYPQVEAISPTLPPDSRDESPLQSTSDDLIKQLEQVDKEISLIEPNLINIRKKQRDLQAAAEKGESQSQLEEDDSKETRHQSTSQIIYAENRKKAEEAHSLLKKLIILKTENIRVLPIYHQPSDCEVYQENKRNYMKFRPLLMENFKRKQVEIQNAEQKLSQNYSLLMTDWLRKVDKCENSKKHREKVSKNRELFEKVFPELRKQREDKERFSRVGARVKSDAEMEEIMDGLQEQENEDKKMRAYAVIPPIMMDENDCKYRFINKNGLIEGPLDEYKEHKNVNIWNDQEGDIFKEKFLQHPKNFIMISSHLEKKSVSECIQHYYITKKKENYKMMVKRRMRRPRAKGHQPTMETIHLNTRVRTRGSAAAAQKEVKMESSSDSVSLVGTSATNADETMADLPINGAAIPSASESQSARLWPPPVIEDPPSPMDVSDSVTTAAELSAMEVTEKDKENLNSFEKLPKRHIDEVSADCMDTSEEEGSSKVVRNGGPHNCFICKTRVDHFTLSRPMKPSQAQMFGLQEDQVTPDARVCPNCRCRAVRRLRPQCPAANCSTPKRKLTRLKPLHPCVFQLPASLKDQILAEFQLPNEDVRCCQSCLMKIKRKAMPESDEPVDVSKWPEEEMELFKRGLSEHGCHWSKVLEKLTDKSERECKMFFNTFKEKYHLGEYVAEYRLTKGGKSNPPTVTDEEESGSSTSTCDEEVDLPPKEIPPQIRHDSASDTLSASSPPPPEMNSIEGVKDPTSIVKHSQIIHHPTTREDYDSSTTTLSADEGPIERDSPPEVEHIPHPGEKRQTLVNRSQAPQFPPLNDTEILQDIISHTINCKMSSLAKPDGSLPPDNRDITMETLLQPPVEYAPYDDCEVGLDLTVKKKDCTDLAEKSVSQPIPVPHSSNQLQQNHRPEVQPVRAPVASPTEKGSPPKAHSNSISYLTMTADRYQQEFRKSPIFFSEPRSAIVPSSSVSSGSRVTPPLMVYTNQGTSRPAPTGKLHKPAMAPPLPVAVSSPNLNQMNLSQNSQRRPPHKSEKGPITIHGGSITRGTPVNHMSHMPTLSHPSRYDLIAKTVVPREAGSITQGTPVHHESKRPANIHIKDNAIPESRGAVEIIPRQAHEILSREAFRAQGTSVGGGGGGYAFTTYANYQTRPTYSDSQLSCREILQHDYMTSQQMPVACRRGTPIEKEITLPQRVRDPSPQGTIKDMRLFPCSSVESMSALVDRRMEHRKDMTSLELRPVSRGLVPDRKVHIMPSSSGFVPVHNPQHYYPGDNRGSRSSNSPALMRDTTVTPPTSEMSHDYRIPPGLTAHALPHSRISSVIQAPNKTSSMRGEPDRYSPHLPVINTGPDYVRRDTKQMEGLGGVMMNNRHRYDQRPSSREKSMNPTEDKRYGDRRERFPIKDMEDGDKMLSNYPANIKQVSANYQQYKQRMHQQQQNMQDNLPAGALIDSLIKESISKSTHDEAAHRAYRREAEQAQVYTSSELDKRARSPGLSYHKKNDTVLTKDVADMSRSGNSASMYHSIPHHVNLLKTSQAHIDSVINREFAAGLEAKKLTVGNHVPYGRPPLEIIRTDGRQQHHVNQYELSKMHNAGQMLYHIESDHVKDRYESKSPHRQQLSSNSHHASSHMSKDEREIVRIPQSQTGQSAFSFITKKLKQIWEETPSKDIKPPEASMSRNTTPVPSQHRQLSLPHHSPSGHLLPTQGIRSNCHFEDESVRKRPRLELHPDSQRPPSRPRSSGSEPKDHGHRDEVADSPQSGDMVIDEGPSSRESVMKMSVELSDRPNSRSSDDKSGGLRSKSSQFQNPYHGYSQAPSNWTTQSALTSKNGRFQGYEPNVEPVSDDE